MKKLLVAGLLLGMIFPISAQEKEVKEKKAEGFQFTTIKEAPITSIKNQNRTGTCWAFSGIGFLESEALRLGKGTYDFSEMFVVNHSYKDKADAYVRLHGKLNFAEGGSFADVLYAFKHYGAVPEEIMKGLEYGEDMHVHSEMAAIASNYIEAVIKNKNGKLSPVWKKGFNCLIDSYLGELPETFTYNGKTYTPKSYFAETGINIDDYVSLTSYSHHPFYDKFVLEIEDNWRWAQSYNLPIDEFMQVMENAIMNGYPIAWGSDVSETGFTRNGIAILPDIEAMETSGSDQARWVGLSPSQKRYEIAKMMESPCTEITPTQEFRQKGFDNYQTTDDHGMLIFGLAKDQTGKKYYMVKNSWGTDNKYKGVWYASENFVAGKTMNIVLHKNAIPKNIRKKLGL